MRQPAIRPALALSLVAATGSTLAGSAVTAEAHPTRPEPRAITAGGVDRSRVWVVSSAAEYGRHFAAASTKVRQTKDAAGVPVVLSTTTADKVASFHADPGERRRCPGFRAFTTRAEAESFIAHDRTRATTQHVFADYTIDNDATVKPWLDKVQHEKIKGTIEHLSTAYPNRYYASKYGKQSAEWVRDTWAGLAKGRSDVTTELFTKCGNCGVMPSVLMTVKGSEKPDEIVVVGGHMDSINKQGQGDAMQAPGADDDASGIGTITEMARVAFESGWKPKRTVVFAGYSSEEVGLRGSKSVAQDFKAQGRDVVGVLQLDMTNYDSKNGTDIAFMTDNVNGPLRQFGEKLFDHYLAPSGLKRGTYTCGYSCSDHASWTSAGYPSSMTSEPVIFPHRHTTQDNLGTFGNSAQPSEKFAKFGLAFLGEIAKTAGTAATSAPTSSAASQR